MAVSLRMDALLEKELELAAKQRGISKSQFIVDAVHRALGRKDPFALLEQIQSQSVSHVSDVATAYAATPASASTNSVNPSTQLKAKLAAKQEAAMADWQAFQAAKKKGKTWNPNNSEASTSISSRRATK